MFVCVCRAGCQIISASVHLLTFFCSSESSGVTGDGEDSGEIYARRGGGDTVSNWPQQRTTLAARRGTADLHCTPDIQVSGEVCKA